jgi:hypothetical protein
MPYNVPEEEKSAFNQKVKSSLELLTGDVSRTLGQLKVLQPETLVEAYERPVDQQEALPTQEGVATIVSEYQQPVSGDIMSVTPYQQAVTNASLAETDSLRNETGAIMDSPIEVFSKPLDRNKIKLLGLADDEMKPTEKGKLFYNLQEAGMFDDTGVITEKGAAYLTPINELGKPENLKAFQTLWDDKVIRPSASFGEITENTAKFLGDAVVGGAEGIALGAESVWRNSQTWSGLFGKTDNRPQALRDKLTANNLGLIEGAVENLSGWAGMADVGAAWIGKKLYDVLPAGMEEEAEQAMYAARQRQWQTQQDIANLDAGEIAEAVLGIDNAVKEAEDAKSRMGKDAFDERYRQAGAFSQLAADPTNVIPASLAVRAARMAPLANRLSITAQKRITQIAAQDLAIAQGRTAIEAANSVLKKEAATVGIANRLGADIASRAGANPELVARANQASQVAGRITQSADKIRATLPAVSTELEGLVAKRNSLATRIPEAYAQKVLQTMEAGRQIRSMPAKAIGATLERVGDTLSRTDDAVTNFLKERGLDQMYTAAVGAAGVVGLAGSPIIGAVATGAAALKAGNMLSNYGKLFRYVGKEMENVRGQIPFWKRVAAHTAPNSLGRGIAHTFNMLDLGGVTSDVLRRTGRGIAAAAPTDLMFEYLSDGADMRPETLYQAAAESLVIGGSFAAAGGAFMGTKQRMRELSIGDELNFKRDIVDPRQKALFDSVPSGIRKAIATYSIANPTLNYQFKDSGASQYDPNTNTATINVKSTNPIKALIAHETLHHTIIKNNMESGISALFLGDMKQNTVGGLFRSRDGKLDPNFEAFKDAYYKRLGVAEMSNAERDAIYPLDKVAVEYFIEKHSDQYSAMAESGELGGIAASGAVKRKLGSILETVLPRIPVLKDLHFKSGGMIDKDGSWVTGNGILDAEGIKTDPITNKMFRDMNRRSAGLATGQFEPLISDKADSGAQIILNPSDSIDSELLHPLVKTDDYGRPVLENGKPVALDKATELERALAGLTALEVMRRKRSENYAPEKGEAYVDSEGEFQTGWLSDDIVSEMFARNRFNPEQKRIIREVNKLVRKGTGDRVVMINFPATTRNKANKVIYKPQGATLRDTVPVAMTISKDGNLLFGLMSVTKLNENIAKRSQSKRGKRLYSGNVDLILQDTQAMMDYHKSGVDSIEYFSQKYGAIEADERKKFINTMFGLLNQKEQAVLNPMLLEDGIKSRDNVYRTYRADRVSKAVPMLPQDYPAMPFSYEATSQVKMPEKKSKTKIYHGTTGEIANIIEKNGFDVSKSADGTIWFTDNKSSISSGEVAASGSGAVIERIIDEKNLKLGGWEETDKYSTNELINQGYDGLKLKGENETTYQIFNPEKLKTSKNIRYMPEQVRQMPERNIKSKKINIIENKVGMEFPKSNPKSGYTEVKMETSDGNQMIYKFQAGSNAPPDVRSYTTKNGEWAAITQADRHDGIDSRMGGVAYPFLESNNVVVTASDGNTYRPVWASLGESTTSSMKSMAMQTTNGTFFVHLMGEEAHISNNQTFNDYFTILKKAKISDEAKKNISIVRELASRKTEVELNNTALYNRARTSKTSIDSSKIQTIDPDISKFFRELGGVKSSKTRGNEVKAKEQFNTALDKLKKKEWFAEFESSLNTKKYADRSARDTFHVRGAQIDALYSIPDVPSVKKYLSDSSDFIGGKTGDIVAAVQVSKNQDAFRIYTGDDPIQESKMKPLEKEVRDKLLASGKFKAHVSYPWVVLGPGDGSNFMLDKSVNAETLFPDYKNEHPSETVKSGNSTTILGAMRMKLGVPMIVGGKTK